MGQQQPGRAAKCAGQMHHRRIDAHQQVECRQRRRRIREIAEQRRKIRHHARRRQTEIGGARPHLKAEPAHARHAPERRQRLERHGPTRIVPVLRPPGPYQPDARPAPAQPRMPGRDRARIGGEIRRRRN